MEKRGGALRKHGPIACGRRDSPSGGICRSLSFVRLRQGPHSCPALAMELGEAQACLSASESKPTSPPGPGAVRSRRGAARRQGAGTQASCPAPVRAAAAPPRQYPQSGRGRPCCPVSWAGRGREAPVPQGTGHRARAEVPGASQWPGSHWGIPPAPASQSPAADAPVTFGPVWGTLRLLYESSTRCPCGLLPPSQGFTQRHSG